MTGGIGIAGAGRVARALGRALQAGVIASRNPEHAVEAAAFTGAEAVELAELPRRAERILIAVSDDAVTAVAQQLAEAGMSGGAALHTSGALGPEALASLAARGVACGVLHPLQTIASGEQSLAGVAFAIAGEGEAARWATGICGLLGGVSLRIAPGGMPLYHAAAVMASNNVTGLIDAAVILMKAAGIDEKTALGALGPLVRAGVENTLALGPGAALTGPIERGDVETVRRHLRSFADVPPSVAGLYRAAGLHVLEVARRGGLAEAKAREIERLLREGR